ncbi:hypothetical protein IAU60_006797 [Kwoniella sp. DSM 27419]
MTALVEHRTFLDDILNRQAKRRSLIDPGHVFPAAPTLTERPDVASNTLKGAAVEASKDSVVNYIAEEETVRNDHTAWYGASGEFGSNYVLGAKEGQICEEYPALRKLMDLKSALVEHNSHPPLFLPLPSTSPDDLQTALGSVKFDVILINRLSSWEATASLPVRQISADPGFVFLWVGKGDEEGLERGRECLAKWGFRRAEDIVWVKTNRGRGEVLPASLVRHDADSEVIDGDVGQDEAGSDGRPPLMVADNGGLLASQKEHCLMGIRGTVRRSTDMRFVHCNVDTDVMIWEQGEQAGNGDSVASHLPPYLYTLIENFCLGTRRLELFSPAPRDSQRRGWVTSSIFPLSDGSASTDILIDHEQVAQFEETTYASMIPQADGRPVLPFSFEVDALRPKSPQRKPRNLPNAGSSGQGGPPGRFPPRQQSQPQYQQDLGQQTWMDPSQMVNMAIPMGIGNPMASQGFNPMLGSQMPMGMPMNMGMVNPLMMGMGMPMGLPMTMGMPMGMGMGMSMGMPMGMGLGGMQSTAYAGGPLLRQFNGMDTAMGVNGGQPGFADLQNGMGTGTGRDQPSEQGQGGPQGGPQGGMNWQGGWQ